MAKTKIKFIAIKTGIAAALAYIVLTLLSLALYHFCTNSFFCVFLVWITLQPASLFAELGIPVPGSSFFGFAITNTIFYALAGLLVGSFIDVLKILKSRRF